MIAAGFHCIFNTVYYSQKTGWTALFHVAAKGKVDLVQKLVDQGANPNIHDIVGLS